MKKANRYTCTAILGVKQTYLFINLFLEKIDYVNYCKYIYIYISQASSIQFVA